MTSNAASDRALSSGCTLALLSVSCRLYNVKGRDLLMERLLFTEIIQFYLTGKINWGLVKTHMKLLVFF